MCLCVGGEHSTPRVERYSVIWRYLLFHFRNGKISTRAQRVGSSVGRGKRTMSLLLLRSPARVGVAAASPRPRRVVVMQAASTRSPPAAAVGPHLTPRYSQMPTCLAMPWLLSLCRPSHTPVAWQVSCPPPPSPTPHVQHWAGERVLYCAPCVHELRHQFCARQPVCVKGPHWNTHTHSHNKITPFSHHPVMRCTPSLPSSLLTVPSLTPHRALPHSSSCPPSLHHSSPCPPSLLTEPPLTPRPARPHSSPCPGDPGCAV